MHYCVDGKQLRGSVSKNECGVRVFEASTTLGNIVIPKLPKIADSNFLGFKGLAAIKSAFFGGSVYAPIT
jgi:hypothetical protein